MSNFKVVSNAAVVVHAAKADEMLIKGLQSIALPIGFEQSNTTISVMGQRIDSVVPTGGQYTEISINYSFLPDDPSQTFLMSAALNNTRIQDMRFYVEYNMLCGDFAALDLISDPEGAYRIGTMSSPQGSKNEVFSGTVSILPDGPSTLFSAHANGTDLTFTAGGAGVGATIDSTNQDFVALGFKAGQTIILDHVDSLDPLYCKIESVTTNQITLVDGVGDEGDVPTTTGTATTAIHGGTPMVVDGYTGITC